VENRTGLKQRLVLCTRLYRHYVHRNEESGRKQPGQSGKACQGKMGNEGIHGVWGLGVDVRDCNVCLCFLKLD